MWTLTWIIQWKKERKKESEVAQLCLTLRETSAKEWWQLLETRISKELTFLEPPEGTQSADTLTLAQWNSWPPELLNNKSMWFYAAKFVVICYSSSRKLIQLPLLKGKSELLCRAFRGLMLSSPCLTAWLAYTHPTPVPPSPFFTDWIASWSSTAIPFLMPLPGTLSHHLFVWQTPHPLCLSYYKTIPPLWSLSYFPQRNMGLLTCISCLCCFSCSLPLKQILRTRLFPSWVMSYLRARTSLFSFDLP